MLISTKGRYATRMLLDIALHQGDGYVTMKRIAERQAISKKYLEQFTAQLSRAGILDIRRGPQGGYRLLLPPDRITLADVLRLTEDSLAPVSCLEACADTCPRATQCRTLPLWQGLAKVINDYLDNVTLADLIRDARSGFDYVI